MAMTLRLSEDDDRALEALSAALGVSKQEATVRAIRAEAMRVADSREVRAHTAWVTENYADVLERLAAS